MGPVVAPYACSIPFLHRRTGHPSSNFLPQYRYEEQTITVGSSSLRLLVSPSACSALSRRSLFHSTGAGNGSRGR